ncbi:MAG TPA: CDP-alcohol phosphatidyltransferase family protein [Caulobacteraceae bacterium]|jgi:phosphatidylglycerophosphate synthase
MSIAATQMPATSPIPGRPREIEAVSNTYLVHPVARWLVDRLVETTVTPNQVSVASVAASAAAATCYVGLAWPWAAFVGLAFQFAWHVLDGADGDLARRTGRASPRGELIDGVCDHLSQALIYIAFALVLQSRLGPWAWAAAAAAGASHFVQANAYETGRKSYRHFVYGAPWMRQTGAGVGGLGAWLSALYLAVSTLSDPGEAEAQQAMDAAYAAGKAQSARTLYRKRFVSLVKASGVLDSNTRTVAAFLAILAGRPLWFFVFEFTVLNLALAVIAATRLRANRDFSARLRALP